MEKQALHYALLEEQDKTRYMDVVNSPYCREKAAEYEERAKYGDMRQSFGYELLSFATVMRGRYFHYDQKRAARIQQFLQDMQVKYDCDALDPTDFPGVERWQ